MRKQSIQVLKTIMAASTLLCCSVGANAAYGDWTVYNSYHNATKTIAFESLVYVLAEGGLYSYNPEDEQVETYDKVFPLSDNGIYDIVLAGSTRQLVIVYNNGNIDLMQANGNVHNMPDLKESTLNDKTLNSIYVSGADVYISTNSGIVVLDTRRRVISNTFSFGHIVTSVTLDNGVIIATTPDGIYTGNTSDNLLDASNWKQKTTARFKTIYNIGGTYYVISTASQVRRINNNDSFTYTGVNTNLNSAKFSQFNIIDNKLYCFGTDEIVTIDKDAGTARYANPGILYATLLEGTYWAACGTNGLQGYKLDGNHFSTTVSSIIPNSPIRNHFYKLRMYGNRLLAVGGTLEYPPVEHTWTVMKYEDGTWTNFEEETLHAELGDYKFRNALSVVQDPNNSERHLAGGSVGLVEYTNYTPTLHLDHTNSPLTSILPDNANAGFYIRVNGLTYDGQGNLWMANNECDTIIRIMRTDGTWLAYYCDEIARHPNVSDIMFDQRGWAWITSHISGQHNNAGIFVLDTNGTLNQRSDDHQRFIYLISNQDGTSYHLANVNCIVPDLDGAMWIGSNWGTFVVYEPQNIFNTNIVFTQPKVPRNDGTNYADYLLSEIEVRCIAVDGGNRKWFGTYGNGVYLTNADGSEILQHFTTDNSPLISNDIYDIAIEGSTGEVFIATTEGLVSYTGNATNPVASLDNELVKVYPNPVRPDYNGSIIVEGIMSDTDVKIVSAAGRLVNEGTSTGGRYTWDGRTAEGKRVASGIYYVLATDQDGKQGAAAKFLVVK